MHACIHTYIHTHAFTYTDSIGVLITHSIPLLSPPGRSDRSWYRRRDTRAGSGFGYGDLSC